MNDLVDVVIHSRADFVVVVLVGVLSMQTMASTRTVLVDMLRRSERVVADLSNLQLRHPGCVTVFAAAWEQAGGWPQAKLAVIGADPRMLTHLAARTTGPMVPVADGLDAAIVMADQPPRTASRRPRGPHDEHRSSLLTAIAQKEPASARYVEEWLGLLIEHDVFGHSDLVASLSAHLGSDGDYDATAKALGIHRSTARYRMYRIRELTQFDLHDPKICAHLRAATGIVARFSRASRAATPATVSEKLIRHTWSSQEP